MTKLIIILLSAVFINNYVLSRFLILNIDEGYTFLEAMVNSLGSGLGFFLAMVMFSGVRSVLEKADVPKSFKGLPITLVAAAIVSLSFLGFGGVIENLFA